MKIFNEDVIILLLNGNLFALEGSDQKTIPKDVSDGRRLKSNAEKSERMGKECNHQRRFRRMLKERNNSMC